MKPGSKTIPGFPGYYLDSQLRLWGSRYNQPQKLCFDKHNGYYICRMIDKYGKNRNIKWHRVLLLAFKGLPPSPLHNQARHLDDNKLNNNLDNLAWGTKYDNVQDMVKNKKHAFGSKQACSKLTEEEVEEIKNLRGKLKGTEIARLYNVTPTLICSIFKGRNWIHVS